MYDLWYQDGVDGPWYVHKTGHLKDLTKFADQAGWSWYHIAPQAIRVETERWLKDCLLYTSDAADD